MIGSKKTLVFYHGKSDFGENTEWVMQEYSLVGAGLTPYRVMRPGGSNHFGESSSAAVAITEVHLFTSKELLFLTDFD